MSAARPRPCSRSLPGRAKLKPSLRNAEAAALSRGPVLGEEVDHQDHGHQGEEDVQQLVGEVEVFPRALRTVQRGRALGQRRPGHLVQQLHHGVHRGLPQGQPQDNPDFKPQPTAGGNQHVPILPAVAGSLLVPRVPAAPPAPRHRLLRSPMLGVYECARENHHDPARPVRRQRRHLDLQPGSGLPDSADPPGRGTGRGGRRRGSAGSWTAGRSASTSPPTCGPTRPSRRSTSAR